MDLDKLKMLKDYEDTEALARHRHRQSIYTEEASPVFTQQDDGSITVTDFPLRLLMSQRLLDNPRYPELQVDGDYVRILCSNGEAEYRIVERFAYDETVGCERIGEAVWK